MPNVQGNRAARLFAQLRLTAGLGHRCPRSAAPQAVTPPHGGTPKQKDDARRAMMTRPHPTTNHRDTRPNEPSAPRGAVRQPSTKRQAAPDAPSPEPTHKTGAAPARAPRGTVMTTEKARDGDGAAGTTRRPRCAGRERGLSVEMAPKVGAGDTATSRHPRRRRRHKETRDDRKRNHARMESPNVKVTGAARLYRAASVWTAGLGLPFQSRLLRTKKHAHIVRRWVCYLHSRHA